MAALRRGDAEAFQQLLSPLVDPACRLAHTMLGDWQEAEDAVQESALRAWRASGRLREDTTRFRPWFLTIVANECRSRRRARWFRVVRVAEPVTASGGDVAERATQTADLDRALDGMTEDARLALFLRYYLDLSIDDTAAILRITPAAAKGRVHRAARSLRPILALEVDR